ncbi:60S ribosomal protein L29-like [Nannospalax galili]|uniref:60S ribosomal protein L29-like n=1 Tax=Nannospalax galili TaxID=1026970 RepID=UPI0004ED0820|nr:60S ribosomal protein L29-like [Nannospalax galili]
MAQKWHQETPITRCESPKGIYPKLLRSMHFTRKLKKKMPENSSETMSAGAEAVKASVKPKEVKAKIPKGLNHKLHQLAFIAHPKLGKCACVHIAKGHRLCPPKAKVKPRPRLYLWLPL